LKTSPPPPSCDCCHSLCQARKTQETPRNHQSMQVPRRRGRRKAKARQNAMQRRRLASERHANHHNRPSRATRVKEGWTAWLGSPCFTSNQPKRSKDHHHHHDKEAPFLLLHAWGRVLLVFSGRDKASALKWMDVLDRSLLYHAPRACPF